MSKVQILRALLKERLPANDEEIFELFERTAAEYEEELCGLKEENERQRKLLAAAFNSYDKTDLPQEFVKDKVSPSDQQAWAYNVEQQDPELFKNEEEKQEHPGGLEVYSTKCTNVDLNPQFSQILQYRVKDNTSAEDLASSSLEHIKPESDGEDWKGSQPACISDQGSSFHSVMGDVTSHSSEPDTDISDIDCNETREPQSCFYFLKNKMIPLGDRKCNADVQTLSQGYDQTNDYKHRLRHTSINAKQERFTISLPDESCDQVSHVAFQRRKKAFSCSECGKTVGKSRHLELHRLIHTGEKPFSCSQCGKKFNHNSNLKTHMLIHTGEKPFSCLECGKSFNQKSTLKNHMRTHTGEKPFICPQCGKACSIKGNLKIHIATHTGEKRFRCCKCGKAFSQSSSLEIHMAGHTGEKPFCCSECGKTFNQNANLKTHMLIHGAKKPFSCYVCGKSFHQNSSLKSHMIIHTGEKPFSCSECGKTFNQNANLNTHMLIHTAEKQFTCSVCGKSFNQNSSLKNHITHTGEKPCTCSQCGKAFGLKGNLKSHMSRHTRDKSFTFC
ncbi:gastrula zinc finger protein XlCGF26.1-like [Thalassophryne amazonica]|uniref:gastrula zinc finger protein XlCGF26.1-like n=1 Tax=Thalassophryne amazonica TaxID=390379 RepID=UPI0014722EB4|nr:gastrula zinc finger protein XlCGF26.1-like [Thalassophryne amazonica]